jgi:vacuolar-type H+-ATPase subunit H
MTWLAFKAMLKKALAWCKGNSKIILIIVVLVLASFLTIGNPIIRKQLFRILNETRRQRDRELEGIDKAKEAEEEAIKKALERRDETIRKAEESYNQAKGDLDKEKAKEISKIVKKFDKDPERMAREFAERMGFEYVD